MCHSRKSPEANTWSDQCGLIAEGVRRDNFGILVLTDGGGPSSAQREELAQATEPRRYPISVVSSASVVRFIVSSIALFNPAIHSFVPADWRKALSHLGANPREVIEVERVLRDYSQRPHAERFSVLKSVASSIRPGKGEATL
ncbi:MAG TPA: hypothetical protein VJV78_00845 [Polyangiales bacterium]|nr:hypothetical protein [Polyangiales bacterium]